MYLKKLTRTGLSANLLFNWYNRYMQEIVMCECMITKEEVEKAKTEENKDIKRKPCIYRIKEKK